ncbi:exostosin family-domain-containing protein [Jimgerdemannia flammicorona]|uniref:Exostosin family-domain-containing protein n=1 Tax=Jimgerdemannia flammicorona TaxID=994334 RepID=A0A433CZ19_9FUNG|nr:exostosin family-domain-containing protein [Jimgerdemannia flammicorona]
MPQATSFSGTNRRGQPRMYIYLFLPPIMAKLAMRVIVSLLLFLTFMVYLAIQRLESSPLVPKANPLPPLQDDWLLWPPKLENAICRPRIYVYDIPSDIQVSKHIQDTNCHGSNYKSEMILHYTLTDPNSRFHDFYLTKDPETADFFFIPFFGACYLTKCWSEHSWNFEERCNVDENYVIPIMNYIIQRHPYWNRTGGTNHIMVHSMDSTTIYYKNSVHLFQPAIFLTTVGDKRARYASYHRRYRDIIIPSATGLIHRYEYDPLNYLDHKGHPLPEVATTRNIMVLFRGCCPSVQPTDIYSTGVRSLFYSRFQYLPGWDIAQESENDEYAHLLARAKYGLAPVGWTLDTTRLWEYLAFGVVPVIIADGIIEPFEDDVDWDGFVVWVRREDAHRLDSILAAIPDEVLMPDTTAFSRDENGFLRVLNSRTGVAPHLTKSNITTNDSWNIKSNTRTASPFLLNTTLEHIITSHICPPAQPIEAILLLILAVVLVLLLRQRAITQAIQVRGVFVEDDVGQGGGVLSRDTDVVGVAVTDWLVVDEDDTLLGLVMRLLRGHVPGGGNSKEWAECQNL